MSEGGGGRGCTFTSNVTPGSWEWGVWGCGGGYFDRSYGRGGQVTSRSYIAVGNNKIVCVEREWVGGGAGTGYFPKLHCYWQQQKVCVVGGERSGGVLPGVTWLLETPEEGQIRAFTHYIRIFIVVNTHLHIPFKTSKCVCLQNLQV